MRESYLLWMMKVDANLVHKCGCTSDGLPDWAYRDAYDAGVPPKTAAARVIKAARDF